MDADADAAESDDELVLGAETIVPELAVAATPAPAAKPFAPAVAARTAPAATPRPTFSDAATAPAATAGATPPMEGGRRRWLAPGSETPEPAAAPAPRVKLGGTLFERMSNAARGAQREESEGEEPPALDIPRFLHRQNNQ